MWTYLGMVTHLVLWFWEEMALSSSSNAPDFFSFFTRLLTAFSHHLSSASEVPFFQPSKRLTTGGVNDESITFNPPIGVQNIKFHIRSCAHYNHLNYPATYCIFTFLFFLHRRVFFTENYHKNKPSFRVDVYFDVSWVWFWLLLSLAFDIYDSDRTNVTNISILIGKIHSFILTRKKVNTIKIHA